MELLDTIKQNARKYNKKIVLPEAYEERNLRAADIALAEGLAKVILIGDPVEIKKHASDLGLKNIDSASIVNPLDNPKEEKYVSLMVEIRKNKGMTREEALKLIKDPLYLGVLMIKNGDADGEVSGADHATGDVLRPAFHYIKTAPGISVVSGAFIMIFQDKSLGDNGLLIFADSAVNPNPTDKELAEIAVASAHTAKVIAGLEPRVALLSFSTKGSAKHDLVDKVISATGIAQKLAPDIMIDGELQGDAALVDSIGRKKAPGSKIAGHANVLIFPDLNCGNIAYKLVQRLARAEAIGPILQGMAAPVNDLSRGCSVNDIVSMIAIAANQAAGIK
ncbi:MAG: phosphate acetyltransferase [Bacteroidales bacterium]|jgi:phosphate acetyltransferase